jgi:hypothetical protein
MRFIYGLIHLSMLSLGVEVHLWSEPQVVSQAGIPALSRPKPIFMQALPDTFRPAGRVGSTGIRQ